MGFPLRDKKKIKQEHLKKNVQALTPLPRHALFVSILASKTFQHSLQKKKGVNDRLTDAGGNYGWLSNQNEVYLFCKSGFSIFVQNGIYALKKCCLLEIGKSVITLVSVAKG